MAAGDVLGARDVGLLELLLLAHVDHDGAVAVGEQIADLSRVHLGDLLLRAAKEFCSGNHTSERIATLWCSEGRPRNDPGRPFGRPGAILTLLCSQTLSPTP